MIHRSLGELAWKFKGKKGFGFSAAPLIASKKLLIGARDPGPNPPKRPLLRLWVPCTYLRDLQTAAL